MLQDVCGPEVMSKLTIFRWWNHFKEGKRKVFDSSWSRRPTLASQMRVSRKLIAPTWQEINFIGIVCWFKCFTGKGSAHCVSEITHVPSLCKVGSMGQLRMEVWKWIAIVLEQNTTLVSSVITCAECWIRRYNLRSNSNKVFGNKKTCILQRNLTQCHHLERCWYFLTPNVLLFSTRYVRSKLECNLKKI
jgi:hypothetical protein